VLVEADAERCFSVRDRDRAPRRAGLSPGAPRERSGGMVSMGEQLRAVRFGICGTRDLSILQKNALTFQSKTPSEYFVSYRVQDSLDRWSTDHEGGNCAGLEFSSVPEDSEYPVVWHQLHQIL
jgi:hypothetical protein